MANWTEADIQAVWEKGTAVPGFDKNVARKDECNAWMQRNKYGNRESDFGWEIDHISPGGADTLSNLRPLQWLNNVEKSDGRLKCNITSHEKSNVRK
jgi:hypothetical protein